MTELNQHAAPANVRSLAHDGEDELITITLHRGLHAAALQIVHHHIASYEAYANQPTLDHGELHETLVEVTASGVDLDSALSVAHELANHFVPHFINGKPNRLTVLVTDGEATSDEVDAVLQLLRQLNRKV